MGAAAASRVDAAPYAGVEYTQNSGVKTFQHVNNVSQQMYFDVGKMNIARFFS